MWKINFGTFVLSCLNFFPPIDTFLASTYITNLKKLLIDLYAGLLLFFFNYHFLLHVYTNNNIITHNNCKIEKTKKNLKENNEHI